MGEGFRRDWELAKLVNAHKASLLLVSLLSSAVNITQMQYKEVPKSQREGATYGRVFVRL